jgi:uncharacterized C2H2 Zn-finger protein
MAAWCDTCNFFEENSEKWTHAARCPRCERIFAAFPELAEWVQGVAERHMQKHQRDNNHESSDYWD